MNRRRGFLNTLMHLLFLGGMVLALLPGFLVLVWVVQAGLPALSWEFFTQPPRELMRAGGIAPALGGTLMLMAGTLLAAVPVGVGAAVYLNEYAPDSLLTHMVVAGIRNLAAVPGVVFGLFGLTVFVLGLHLGISVLAGSLTLALMVLPVVVDAASVALQAVPAEVREAACALGASPWQVVRRAVLPAAGGGILTGVIMAVTRAAGEAAPILFTAVAFRRPDVPLNPFERVMALPYHLYVLATEVPGMPHARIMGAAVLLVSLTVGVNLIATAVRARFRRTG